MLSRLHTPRVSRPRLAKCPPAAIRLEGRLFQVCSHVHRNLRNKAHLVHDMNALSSCSFSLELGRALDSPAPPRIPCCRLLGPIRACPATESQTEPSISVLSENSSLKAYVSPGISGAHG